MSQKEKAVEFADDYFNVQITGRHLDVTDSMKEYAIDKISKIERFSDRIIDVNVVMDVCRFEHHVEISLKINNFKVCSHATTSDMYASIDKAVSKLEAQIRRYKSKIQDHHAKGHPVVDMSVDIVPLSDLERFEIDQQLDENASRFEAPHHVVKQEKIQLKTLTRQEAVMKMELSQDQFLIYKNESDDRVKVIYRRKDGDYGIIDPVC